MKVFYIVSLFYLVAFSASASPITSRSRPQTPTPEIDPHVPLPGRTGLHFDAESKIFTLHYGDDDLPKHMGHLERNQQEFPHNRNPMPYDPSGANRGTALAGVPPATREPGSNEERVRDEKMPSMLRNPHHATSTTVEYLPKTESNKEGGHLSALAKAMKKEGKDNVLAQLRPNRGWLPLNRDQQRGHEAPARLNSQSFNRPLPSKNQAKVSDKPSNLRPGYTLPEEHVWKPPTDQAYWYTERPSHFGAPAQLKGSEHRYPPRPQNLDHYKKQLAKFNAKFGPAKAGNGAGKAHEAPARLQADHSHSDKYAANLAKFNKAFGPAKSGNGAGNTVSP